MSGPITQHAWVDESMRTDGSHSLYVIAAAICSPTGAEPVRDKMRALLLRSQTRLHWRDETHARRTRIATTIAAVEITAVVVVGAPLAQAKQERGRRKCLEALLPQLADLGVSVVWLESRTPALNKNDDQLIRALRGKRALPASMRVDIARPSAEPMLWVPDAIAGAVNAANRGTPEWLEAIRHRLDIVEISL